MCPFLPRAPVSSTMLQKEAVRVDARACVVVYIFRSVYAVLPCVRASASSTYIYAARWIAYLLGRGRFIECGRRRSDSHVFTSRQFFHLAPLPSRTRTFDVPGPLAVWLFLPLSPFASLSSLLLSLSDQSVSSADIHSSCTRHEIRRDVLSRRLRSDCYREVVNGRMAIRIDVAKYLIHDLKTSMFEQFLNGFKIAQISLNIFKNNILEASKTLRILKYYHDYVI